MYSDIVPDYQSHLDRVKSPDKLDPQITVNCNVL